MADTHMPSAHQFLSRIAKRCALAPACLALWLSGCASRPEAKAPTSDLSRDNAMNLARLTAAAIGGQVFTIAPTGSMKPTLDETSIVAIEPSEFANLRRGDLVVYMSLQGAPILHRLHRQAPGGNWFVLGDNNPAVDAEGVTPKNFIGRVCAIFYTSTQATGGTPAFASPSRANIPAESPKIH